ncbi:MAG TPA: ABC transporter permease, partial [Chthonomonadaceae bacterium]|nr:ABC transporter permease [Chthonomonadaceae bacterium]
YVVRRILYAVPILLGVVLITFFLFYIVISPQQMARRQLGKNPTDEQVHQWLHQRGYDKPVVLQFKDHVVDLFLFRFGNSDVTNEPIWKRIKEGGPVSAQLSLLLLIGGLIGSISVSLFVAYYRGTYIDYWGMFLCVLMMSIVYIVWVVAGQYLLGKILKYSPLVGYREGWTSWHFLMLPVVIGILQGLGSSVRFYRTVMLDEMNLDYVRTARAKGVSEVAILFKHVLKNAMTPILTSTVSIIPQLILGNLVLESFFGIPGLGGITVDAVNSQDFATVRAITFLGAVLYIAGLILTDVSYALFDPRVRLE